MIYLHSNKKKMALKVFKKGNVLAATDTITGETVRINGTFSWYSIDEVNNSVSIGELTNQHKTISALAANVQDEEGTAIGDLAAVDTYLSEATNFKSASGGSGASGLYAQTADGTLVDTSTETSLIGTGVGSLTIAADSLKVGDSFRIKLGGILNSTGGGSPTSIEIKVKKNGSVLATTGFFELDTVSGHGFQVESNFTVRSIGVGGVIVSTSSFSYSKDIISSNDRMLSGHIDQDSEVVDTTSANDLDVTATFKNLNKGNTIQSTSFVYQKTY